MHVLALANQKGGCGKTTTAIHLGGALAKRGERVCLVDLDPQGHATLGLGIAVDGTPSALEVLDGRCSAEAALRGIDVPGGGELALLPATLALSEFEERAATAIWSERALTTALAQLVGRFDRVLIDCPPRADGVLAANAVRAANLLLLVVETGAFSLQGALRAREVFGGLARTMQRRPALRVVATMFDRRTRIAREVLIAMQARFGRALFDTTIRNSVRLREAAAFGLPVQVLDPRSRSAADFDSLASELVAMREDSGPELPRPAQQPSEPELPALSHPARATEEP